MPRWRFRKDRQQPSIGPAESPHAQPDAVGSSVHSSSHSDAPTSLPDRVKAPAPEAISSPPSSVPSAILPVVVGVSASGQDEAPQGTALFGATIKKKDYWQLAVADLQREDPSTDEQITAVREAIVGGEHPNLPSLLLQAAKEGRQALEAKRWILKIGLRSIGVHEQFDRLINAILLFKDVGGAAANLDPLHAGIPFAGVCTLMQMATNDTDLYMSMVVGVEEIVTIMARYHEIERLYHKRSETALKQNFEMRMIGLYKNIIRYQISAVSFFRRNTILRILRSFPKLDDVSDVMEAIRRDDNACKDIDQVFKSSDADERHQELLIKLESLEKSLGNLKTPCVRVLAGEKRWGVTRQLNTMFTGRTDILHELNNIVQNHVGASNKTGLCQIVISGMGGQGKSELCLQLVHLAWPMLWGAFWIDVRDKGTAERDFLAVARLLGSPAESWEEALQKLARVERPWLLVLDNADDPDIDYQQYFPAGVTGVVVLTTRNEECAQYATTKYVALEALPDEAARELLLTAARLKGDARSAALLDAVAVASLLKSHPLALVQAGAYIARGHCTMREYPDEYAKQRKRLMRFRPKQVSRYGDVYATFEASADALSSVGSEAAEDALELLSILAVCGPSRLPLLPLFEASWKGAQNIRLGLDMSVDVVTASLMAWHVSHLPSPILSNTEIWDPFRIVEAIHLLKSLSLVSTDTSDGYISVSMHTLVHAWARDRQSTDEQHVGLLKVGCLVALSIIDDALWWKQARQLQSHLQALVTWDMSTMFGSEPAHMIVSMLKCCLWLFEYMRDDMTLSRLLQNLFDHLRIAAFTVDAQWLELYKFSGRNLKNRGQVQEAVRIQKEILEIQEQAKAKEHPDRLMALYELANTYLYNEQADKAVVMLEEVVKNLEQTLAEDDQVRLAWQYSLAMAYEQNGQIQEAVTMQEEVLRIRESMLEEDHTNRLASQHALAIAYKKNGQVKEAATILEEVVRIEGQTLAEDNPQRLGSQHALALLYSENGQAQKALTMQEEVVRIDEQVLAEDDRSRLVSQSTLATILWDLGQRQNAIKMMEQVVKFQQRVLDERHPGRNASNEWLDYMLAEVASESGACAPTVANREGTSDRAARDRRSYRKDPKVKWRRYLRV